MSAPGSTVQIGSDAAIPAEGIRSTTLHTDARARVVSIAMAPGAELKGHTAPSDATLLVVRGRVALDLGEEHLPDAGPGTWTMMPKGLHHAARALEPTVLLLTLRHD